MLRSAHPLGIQADHLTIEELWALDDALRTVGAVMAGLCCQPKFITDGIEYNAAGDIFDTLMNQILCEADDIHAAVRERVPETDRERGVKFGMLALEHLDGLSHPKDQFRGIAALASDMAP